MLEQVEAALGALRADAKAPVRDSQRRDGDAGEHDSDECERELQRFDPRATGYVGKAAAVDRKGRPLHPLTVQVDRKVDRYIFWSRGSDTSLGGVFLLQRLGRVAG